MSRKCDATKNSAGHGLFDHQGLAVLAASAVELHQGRGCGLGDRVHGGHGCGSRRVGITFARVSHRKRPRTEMNPQRTLSPTEPKGRYLP